MLVTSLLPDLYFSLRSIITIKVFLEAKVTLSDCRNFFSANRQREPKLTCKVSGRYNQNLPRYRRANFRF